MNREDIIRMAREAKGHPYTHKYAPGETAFAFSIDRLEHFVSLVAAAERDACVKVIENYCGAWDDEGFTLASTIRARGNNDQS